MRWNHKKITSPLKTELQTAKQTNFQMRATQHNWCITFSFRISNCNKFSSTNLHGNPQARECDACCCCSSCCSHLCVNPSVTQDRHEPKKRWSFAKAWSEYVCTYVWQNKHSSLQHTNHFPWNRRWKYVMTGAWLCSQPAGPVNPAPLKKPKS